MSGHLLLTVGMVTAALLWVCLFSYVFLLLRVSLYRPSRHREKPKHIIISNIRFFLSFDNYCLLLSALLAPPNSWYLFQPISFFVLFFPPLGVASPLPSPAHLNLISLVSTTQLPDLSPANQLLLKCVTNVLYCEQPIIRGKKNLSEGKTDCLRIKHGTSELTPMHMWCLHIALSSTQDVIKEQLT